MDPQEQNRIIRRRGALALIIFVALMVVWWLSGHSYITITVAQPPADGKLTYSLMNQGSKKFTTVTASSTSITKLVSKGNYEVTVSESEASSFTIVKTKGFLRKSVISSTLSPEPDRQFVGNNPEGCMYYLENVLYSYGCEGSSTRTTHVPATANTPTYNLKGVEGVFGSVEGIVSTQSGLVALYRTNSTPHAAYKLSSSTNASQGVSLSGLDQDIAYRLASYSKGFIVYDPAYSSIRYYQDINAKPQTITTPKPDDKNQEPYLIGASTDAVAVTYSDKASVDVNSDSRVIGKVKSTVSVYSNGQSHKYAFSKQFSSVTPCGTNRLCVVDFDSKQLSVYDIAKAKAKLLYSLENVNSIQPLGKNLLIVRNDALLSLDVDKSSGSIAYKFSDYHFCGLQNDGPNYLLCVTDSNAKNSVLRLNPSMADADNIDKKVAELQKLQSVANVSAYGNYIYVSPDAGPLKYNQEKNIYEHDPDTLKSVNEVIATKVKELNFNPSKYMVINPLR